MKELKKKHIIKIPKNIVILYCNKKKIITVLGPLAKKSLKIKVKIDFLNDKNIIKVSSTPFSKIANNQKKKMAALQGSTISLIKQAILETSYKLYKKLKLVGIGYRTFDIDNYSKTLIGLRLGYSHPIYFKIPQSVKISNLKRTKLFLYGISLQDVSQMASLIRSYKKPEPYKGKGILYETEKINLKEGKKI